jgi:hypothetical protein
MVCMNYLKIEKNKNNVINGKLTNDKGSLNIPITLIGSGILNISKDKELNLDPEKINVFKNNKFEYSMKNIKLSNFFGKNVIEGVNDSDSFSAVIVDTSEIKNMWTNDYNGIWNIDV